MLLVLLRVDVVEDLAQRLELHRRDVLPILEQLGVLQAMEDFVLPPTQLLLNLVALRGKPNGQEMPTGLMAMPYRRWARMRKLDTDSWREARAGHWDTAIAGPSAMFYINSHYDHIPSYTLLTHLALSHSLSSLSPLLSHPLIVLMN